MILPRRAAFFGLALAVAAALFWLLARVLAPGGWSVLDVLMLTCFVPVALWFGVCVGNALPGFALLFGACPPRTVLPVRFEPDATIHTPTALLVTVRHEEMGQVLPALGRLLAGLGSDAGWFTPWILSDTADPALAEGEAAAIAAFPWKLRYRRRAANTGFKAGNVMEFLDHHAEGLDLAVMLDADSEMSAEAVLRLVRIMQAGPRLGIVQHLTVGRPTDAAFPRLFQFGMRAGMRVWATGQAWWQGDEGPYWGHNAILRIAPFRTHCRLAPLPDGSAILSHDQLEAALLRAAGWGVALWAGEDGSREANPPALPEFLHRDARWLAGNLQYRHLITGAGLRPMGRWQLAQAMLMFAVAPALSALLVLAALLVASAAPAPPPGVLAALLVAALLAVHSPKLLGYADILRSARRAAPYGGRRRFALGAAAEILFTTLLDPITAAHRSLALTRHLLGAAPAWPAQNRGPRGVGWAEAARRFWPQTLFGALIFALLTPSWTALLWAVPLAGGLVLAIPFAVATSHPRLAALLQRHHLTRIPEDAAPHPAPITR